MPRNVQAAPPAEIKAPEALSDWGAGLVDVMAKLGETAVASSTVIGERLGLAMTALADPEAVDHDEFTLMATEKLEGFADSFSAVMGGLWQVGHAVAGIMTGQALNFGRAAVEVGAARGPFEVLAAQQRWFDEALSSAERQTIRVANGLGSLPGSALAPVHSRVTDNARRLGRRGKAIVPAGE
jgi:hypothetical protein